MKTFRDLIVWQKAMSFVTEIYSITKTFPQEEQFGLSSQIRRSAVSVPSNVAEGYGRHSTQDYIRFLRIGISSLFELQTQLDISHNLHYLDDNRYYKLYEKSREIERMLSSLINKLASK